MDVEEYYKLYKFEETNWWYVAKRRLIFGFLNKIARGKPNLKLLDVGCGTGIIIRELNKFGEAYGIDCSNEALKFCRTRGLKNIERGSAESLPFDNNSFDIIGCFDVLYHKAINNDDTAIKEIYRVCKNGGYFIMTDSAMMCLWSKHDIIQHSRTRYSTKEIREKLERAGFKIVKSSYYYFGIFPFVFVARKIDNIFNKNKEPKVNVYNTNKSVNYLLDKIMKIEYKLIKKINLPFGSSVFCIAKKE